MGLKEVKIPYRDCKVMYEVDQWSIAKMADHYGIQWDDMKKAMRGYGFTIRLHEPKPTPPPKNYVIELVDTDKIVEKMDTPVKVQAS